MTRRTAPKRLTYIVNHLAADGSQHFVHIPNLLREMEKLGWQIDLVSERGGKGRAEVLGRRVTFLSQRSKLVRIANFIRVLLQVRRDGSPLVFVRISKFAAFASAALGRIFGWKTVYWLSGTIEDFNSRRRLRGHLQFAGMWILFRLVDRLVTGPETMVNYYRGLYRLPEQKVLLLYNDVQVSTPPQQPDRSAGDDLHVLIVHRLSPVRESARYFPVVMDVLGKYARESQRTVTLDVCGDGPERRSLEEMAASSPLGVVVRFHGAVPQRRLAEFYARATIFAMPSYREGFPRVIIEAMAHGLPIVATDAGGTRDVLGHGQQAYVVGRDDPIAFGCALRCLLNSPQERRAAAEENLNAVRRFSTTQVAQMYDRALSDVIGADPAK